MRCAAGELWGAGAGGPDICCGLCWQYKLMLVEPSEDRLHHLTTQLKWRVLEGQGEAIYAIGVEDDGACTGITEEELLASLATLKRMAEAAKCEMSLIRRQQARKGWCAEVLVRELALEGNFIDMRVAIVGNVDSGKSTIVGVLTSGACMRTPRARARARARARGTALCAGRL